MGLEINFLYVSWPRKLVPTVDCTSYIILSNYEPCLRKTGWRKHKNRSIIICIPPRKKLCLFSRSTNTVLNELFSNLSNESIFFSCIQQIFIVHYISNTVEAARDRKNKSSVKKPCVHGTYILAMHTHMLKHAQFNLEVNWL